MPVKNGDLYGFVPDQADLALLLKADIRPSEDLDFVALARGLQRNAETARGLERGSAQSR